MGWQWPLLPMQRCTSNPLPGSRKESGTQNSSRAQSVFEPQGFPFGHFVGAMGQLAAPGATQAPVVWQHTSCAAHWTPLQTVGLKVAHTTSS